MTVVLSNSLTVLADDVRSAMNASESAERTAIQAAIDAGRLLNEAKTACRHGEWLPFLKRSGVPERKAQRYMRLAWSGLKSDTVSDIGGIKATLRWMDGLRSPEQDECLIISLDGFCGGTKKPLAVAWPVSEGIRLAVFTPHIGNTPIGLRVRTLEKTDALLPSIYAALGHRHREMSFQVAPALTVMGAETERLAQVVAAEAAAHEAAR